MINKILYLDDGLGAIMSCQEFKKHLSCNYDLLVDNVNYPYSLRSGLKNHLNKGIDLFDFEYILTTNPAIALCLDNKNLIDGLDSFYGFLKSKDLVITNKRFKNHLEKERKDIRVIDGQLLSNQIQIFTSPIYIIDNILKSYIGDEDNIYFMDTNFYIVKDYIKKLYPNRNLVFIQDLIIDQLKEKKSLSQVRIKRYLTGYRRSVYLNLEEKYKASFIDIKELRF